MNKLMLMASLFFAQGCIITGNDKPPMVEPILENIGASNCVAICVGLTSVLPSAYDGWEGDCPGTDVDARGMYNLFVSKGMTAHLILNSMATWETVRLKMIDATSKMVRGDLLIVMMSSHGGQIRDDNGDEADGMDETVCLWDGQVRDDAILEVIRSFPAGIRVVLINDQCHSEGNFKSAVRFAKRAVSFGSLGKFTAKPLIKTNTEWGGQLIQFAGCRESSYSYGADDGGTWTQSLLSSLPESLSWRNWFDNAASKMPENQVPMWTEYGAVTDEFRNGPALK